MAKMPKNPSGLANVNDGGFGEAAYCHHRHHLSDEMDEGVVAHSNDFDTCQHSICVASRVAASNSRGGEAIQLLGEARRFMERLRLDRAEQGIATPILDAHLKKVDDLLIPKRTT